MLSLVCQKQKKHTHCGSYLMPEEAAKAHEHTCVYQASQAWNNITPVYKLFEEALADNLTAPQVRRDGVLCNDAQHIQKFLELRNASRTLV